MKVHFAGDREAANDALIDAGVRYRLRSYYEIRKDPNSRRGSVADLDRFEHVIIDSGLFTLMFGAQAGTERGPSFFSDWLDEYTAFINSRQWRRAAFVELDVQRVVSPEAAWELRREMRARVTAVNADGSRCPVINVYHLPDGNPDALIDYSDYIAISLPELRQQLPSAVERERIVSYISTRAIKRGKRVHLLGCTARRLLRQFSHCTSCDSTSWQAAFRYGSLPSTEFGRQEIGAIRQLTAGKPDTYNEVYWSAVIALRDYRAAAGSQD